MENYMKCVVTGHTNGIGKAIYHHFLNKKYDVIGMSRSNGYNILTDQEKIITEANGCDIFVNCACDGTGQLELLNALHNKVKNMIVLGSVNADFGRLCSEYNNKSNLQERCKKISNDPDINVANILYLKLSFCENTELRMIEVDPKFITSFDEINKAIDLWLEIPKIYSIEFTLKITPKLENFAKEFYEQSIF